MTTWINRFIAMQPGDALLTISEDLSTLTALLDELRDLQNPPGEQENPTLLAARAVVYEAADEVKLVRQQLRECEDRHKATINAQAERYRELRAELKYALDRNSSLRDNEHMLLRQLSDALTGGNASTWDEVLHAATIQRNK